MSSQESVSRHSDDPTDVMMKMMGLTTMELMSLSWPVKVWMQWEPRMSHSLADASQAPDTNVFCKECRVVTDWKEFARNWQRNLGIWRKF